MSQTIANLNRVIFGIGEFHIDLKLDRPWVRSCGVYADVNTALVPYTIYSQIGDVSNIVGTVQFFFTPGKDLDIKPGMTPDAVPDVTLYNIKIVDVEPTKWGIPDGGFSVIVLEYRLSFADARRDFGWPFGGHLAIGEINKEPLSESGGQDANGHDLLNPQQMVQLCLDAMGVNRSIASNSLSDLAKIFNVEWRGNHAPSELKKILDATGHTMFCDQRGKIGMAKIGAGSPPVIPDAQYLPPLPFQGVDRRGDTVVFTGAPSATLTTDTLVGLTNAEGDDVWSFVIQNEADQWQKIADTAFFANVDIADMIRQGLPQIGEKWRVRVKGQLYRYLRLNTDIDGPNGPAPIRRVVEEQTKVTDIRVEAKIAYPRIDGTWKNSDDFVGCNVVNLIEGEIIETAESLRQVTQEGPDPVATYKLIGDQDVRVRITRERFVKDNGRWNPQYFYVGFQQQLGVAVKLDGAAIKNAIADPKTAVVRRPDFLRVIYVDGVSPRQDLLEAICGDLAPRYIRSADKSRHVMARGYCTGEPSGLVGRIQLDQEKLLTTFEVNTWWLPHDDYAAATVDSDQGPGSEKFPEQAATQSRRTAEGESGSVQPSVPILGAPPTEASASTSVKVKITGPAGGGGKYNGVLVSGKSTAAEGTDEVQPEGMTPGGETNVLIVNLFENLLKTHRLPQESYHIGKMVGGGSNGATVEIEACECDGNGPVINLGSSDTANETADTTSVEAADQGKIIVETYQSRPCYFEAGDATLYAFFRTRRIACGVIADISAETRVAVFTTCA